MKGGGTVVALSLAGQGFDSRSFSYPDYVDLRDHNKSFSGLIASDVRIVELTGTGETPALVDYDPAGESF